MSPPAALTSDARPEVASVAFHQAIQVGEPGYLQVRADIVPNIIHRSGNKGPLVMGWEPGTGPRSFLGDCHEAPQAGPGQSQECLPKTGGPREEQCPGFLHLPHQPLCSAASYPPGLE